jgi:iron(III) transport system ATP-binding protein
MAEVVVERLHRRFGGFTALSDVSFDVRAGEFLTLLGPSGCGKSTTLAALAGLDRPTSGRICIGPRVVFDSQSDIYVDAQFRGIGLMFQSYALWPHMTVEENLDFGLKLRKIRGAAARQKLQTALEMVEIASFAKRYPGELSGGQQQRVALARTMVYEPALLLLDEPLSNLDAKLRDRARLWLGDLQRRTGITMIYVTHDQSEALALSDRIIVMNAGSIAQIGTPAEIYETPQTPFVADFVGASNLLDAVLVKDGTGLRAELSPGLTIAVESDPRQEPPQGRQEVTLSVRPERIVLDAAGDDGNAVPYRLLSSSYLGSRRLVVIEVAGRSLRAEMDARVSVPQSGHLRLPARDIRYFLRQAGPPGAAPKTSELAEVEQ